MALDRPLVVREAILACRSAGIVSILGVYAGFMDKFPIGPLMNRGITIRTGQCHVHRYMKKLLGRIERGDIDPSFVVSHHMNLDQAPEAYAMFMEKRDDVMKNNLRACPAPRPAANHRRPRGSGSPLRSYAGGT
jgi:threonine dehydrogenase-like Zn-dependent dehydrogenase